MRTSLRATIAIVVALGVLLVAAVAFADPNDPVPPAAQEPDGGDGVEPGNPGTGGGAAGACLVGTPDFDDTVEGPDGENPIPPRPGRVEPQIVEPTPGMTNVRARPFDAATVGGDGRTVTIDFWSGVEPCYVLDHVDVAYGDAVIVTLFEGSAPTDAPVACIEIAVAKRVVITLDEPLGDRPIIDGAAPEEPAA
jgi:hypothetical protein